VRPPGAWVAKLSEVFSHINKDRVASVSVILQLLDACRDRTSSAQQGQEVFVIIQNEMLFESHIFGNQVWLTVRSLSIGPGPIVLTLRAAA
jgi:hypothetical protein